MNIDIKGPVRMEVITKCKHCGSRVTRQWFAYWGCENCDAWVKDVTQEKRPYSVIDTENVA